MPLQEEAAVVGEDFPVEVVLVAVEAVEALAASEVVALAAVVLVEAGKKVI